MLKMPTPDTTFLEKDFDSFEECSYGSGCEEDDVRSLASNGSEPNIPEKVNDVTAVDHVEAKMDGCLEGDERERASTTVEGFLRQLDKLYRPLRGMICSGYDEEVEKEAKIAIEECVRIHRPLFGDRIGILAEEHYTLHHKYQNAEMKAAIYLAEKNHFSQMYENEQRRSNELEAAKKALEDENEALRNLNGNERRNSKQDINSLKALLDVEKEKSDAGHGNDAEGLRQKAEEELQSLEQEKDVEIEHLQTEAKANANKRQTQYASLDGNWVHIFKAQLDLAHSAVSTIEYV